MLNSIKNIEDSEELEELVSMNNQVEKTRLQDN